MKVLMRELAEEKKQHSEISQLFPIKNTEGLQRLEANISNYNEQDLLTVVQNICQRGGISKNLYNLITPEIFLNYNYDGIQKKEVFKVLQANNNIFYKASQDIYINKENFIVELKKGFKIAKNKVHKTTCLAKKNAVVCLPYFLLNLPQECLPAFEKFNELIFWFDCDSTDWDAARSISQKLNENRCYVIRPTINEPSPYKAYKRGIDIRKILIKATPVLHKSITTFETLKQDVFCELQNIEKVNGVKWKRFPVLNKLLKGHRKGELTIITGPTGSGKTTFMSEYSLDLALQGVSTLWGSFELRNSRLAAILLRQFVGYSLEKKLNEFDHWATEFEKYPLYFMTFHGQESIQIVMDTIEHARYVFDISHVIIDNLQFMMGTSSFYKKDKFWEQDEIISSFRSFATQKNVHVTLVVHPRKERNEEDLTTNSVFGSAKATQEADNVLIIQEKRLVHSKSKKFLQIAKNRFCGDLGFMPLEFDKEGLSYSNLKKQN